MKTIEQHFETFAQMVIPPSASEHQRGDMRMAFFAGATAMLTLMSTAASNDVSDDVGASRIALLEREIRQFTANLAKAASR